MSDLKFPVIHYSENKSPREWGRYHGESYREAIKELFDCRYELLCRWVEDISVDHVEMLSQKQWQLTKKYAPDIYEELFGISEGSGLTFAEIVILNNYTDFRDISVPNQGCSTVHWQDGHQAFAGQTWDMHRSARKYLCVLKIPKTQSAPAQFAMSVVGCVGLMGYNSLGAMIGVNNLVTQDARPGVLWPAIVRKSLALNGVEQIKNEILSAPITSGRNFLIAKDSEAEMWEVTPTTQACVGKSKKYLYHTNHCLNSDVAKNENHKKLSSTTHHRFKILESRMPKINSGDEMLALLKSHEGLPISICTHTDNQNGDPSETCGGAFANLSKRQMTFWRGCSLSNEPYVQHQLEFQP
jgi:isopenicillin-N N-acyltransferase like protein